MTSDDSKKFIHRVIANATVKISTADNFVGTGALRACLLSAAKWRDGDARADRRASELLEMRERVLNAFMDGDLPLLVASDVASRGLHINDVSHIINYDIPQDPEDYVHRIGRTARAGKEGVAFTLACDEYVSHLGEIENLLDRRIPFRIPDPEDFGEDNDPSYDMERHRRDERRRKGPGGPRRGGGGGGRRSGGGGGGRRGASGRSGGAGGGRSGGGGGRRGGGGGGGSSKPRSRPRKGPRGMPGI